MIYNPLYAVSACLLGWKCRYDGKDKRNDSLINDIGLFNLFPICPEVFAGLQIPRQCCSIANGDGFDVLRGDAWVIDKDGMDFTQAFITGAFLTFEALTTRDITECFLKSKSPSCGLRSLQTKSNYGLVTRVTGVTAALLLSNGMRCEEIL